MCYPAASQTSRKISNALYSFNKSVRVPDYDKMSSIMTVFLKDTQKRRTNLYEKLSVDK